MWHSQQDSPEGASYGISELILSRSPGSDRYHWARLVSQSLDFDRPSHMLSKVHPREIIRAPQHFGSTNTHTKRGSRPPQLLRKQPGPHRCRLRPFWNAVPQGLRPHSPLTYYWAHSFQHTTVRSSQCPFSLPGAQAWPAGPSQGPLWLSGLAALCAPGRRPCFSSSMPCKSPSLTPPPIHEFCDGHYDSQQTGSKRIAHKRVIAPLGGSPPKVMIRLRLHKHAPHKPSHPQWGGGSANGGRGSPH